MPEIVVFFPDSIPIVVCVHDLPPFAQRMVKVKSIGLKPDSLFCLRTQTASQFPCQIGVFRNILLLNGKLSGVERNEVLIMGAAGQMPRISGAYTRRCPICADFSPANTPNAGAGRGRKDGRKLSDRQRGQKLALMLVQKASATAGASSAQKRGLV